MTGGSLMMQSMEQRVFLSGAPLTQPAPLMAAEQAPAAQYALASSRPAEASSRTYNLMDLFALYKRGSTSTYRASGTVSAGGIRKSATVTGKVSIDKQPVKVNGHDASVARVTGPRIDQKYLWYSDRTGIYCAMVENNTQQGKIRMNLRDACIAPRSLAIGQSYSDQGTFDCTVTVLVDGEKVTGTATGSVASTCRLTGTEKTKVGTTQLSAVKGEYEVKTSGNVRFRYHGHSYTAHMDFTIAETFWAVPGIGRVRSVMKVPMKISVEDQSVSIGVTMNMEMTGSSLVKSTAKAARSQAIFADRPISDLTA